MKILRNIGLVLLSIILFADVFLFSASFVFNEMVKKKLVPEIIKEVVINQIAKDDEAKEIKEGITAISNVKGFNELFDYSITEVFDCKKNNRGVSDEAIDKIFTFIIDNKKEIEEITKTPIDEQTLKSHESRTVIKQSINNTIRESNIPTDDYVINILNSYKYVTSDNTFIIYIIVFVVATIIIALLHWSWYKWMKDVSRPLIFVGLNVGLSYYLLNVFSKSIGSTYNVNIDLTSQSILYLMVGELSLGLAFFIGYTIINGIRKD